MMYEETPPTAPLTAGEPTLVYWDICGLGEAIRLALAFSGGGFDDVRLDPGTPGEASYKCAWVAAKPSLGLRFPNLPYFLDGDIALTQSNAILRHIGRTRAKLQVDVSAATLAQIDQALEQASDLDDVLTGACYRGGASAVTAAFESRLPSALAELDRVLALNGGAGPFVLGSVVSIADFKIFELLRKCRIAASEVGLAEDPLAGLGALSGHVAAVAALPAVAAYIASPEYSSRPLNNPHAQLK